MVEDSDDNNFNDSKTIFLVDGKIPVLSKGTKLFLLNIRGLVNKMDSLRHLISNNSVDIFCLNETFCDSTITDNELLIDGLRIERKDRTRTGGGVAIYINEKITYFRRHEFEDNSIEMICLQVHLPYQKACIIFCIYRPPSSDSSFYDKLESVLERTNCLHSSTHEIFILGDLNCDYLNSSKFSKLDSVLRSFNFTQFITKPTRVTNTSETLIDIISTTNIENISEHGCIHTSLSDHFLVYAIHKIHPKCKSNLGHKLISFRSFKNFDNNEFRSMLTNAPLSRMESVDRSNPNVNDYLLEWTTIIIGILNSLVPKKQLRVRKESVPWINADLRSLMTRRDRLHRKFISAKRTNNNNGDVVTKECNQLWSEYKSLRNQVNNVFIQNKREYFKREIKNNQGNPKGMWKCLRSLIPKMRKDLPRSLHLDGHSFDNDISIANAFNDYLIQINISDLQDDGSATNPPNVASIDPGSSVNPFEFDEIYSDTVKKIINNLDASKATGLDEISAKLIKNAGDVILPSITKLMNLSLSTGTYPEEWKHSKILPLHKKGDVNAIKNYRPISILPVLSKILERIVHKQLHDYLVSNDVLSNAQFGFRPGHTTASALGALTDTWLRAIDDGQIVGALFVDLKRAFDTVDSSILLDKLKKIGLSSSAISWFRSYLTNRKQQVSIRQTLSNERYLSVGVPQGSILGPLLFLIYIDDVVQVLKQSNVIMYADDTTLYVVGSSYNELQITLQHELNVLGNWIRTNKLQLNVDKTKLMIIGSKQKLNSCHDNDISITYNGIEIEHCASFKCLGVVIDKHLLWHDHVNSVCRKIYAGLAMLKRIRPFVEDDTLKLLYSCLIQSQMDYCCEIWGDRFNTHIERITKLQKRAARLILMCNIYTPSKDLFSRLRWQPFTQRIVYFRAVFVYKCLNNISARYYDDYFHEISETHTINTRQSSRHDLAIPKYRTEYFTHSLSFLCPKLWNDLPVALRELTSLSTFKLHLKLHLTSNQA